ncbi:MAG: hypothetical protein GY870_11870 [archaeon]|nr:hypothetical protein [archaeon]
MKDLKTITTLAALRAARGVPYVVFKTNEKGNECCYDFCMAHMRNGNYERKLTFKNGYVIIEDSKGNQIEKRYASKDPIKKSDSKSK